ncbi:hypothetical protein PRZ48_014726 [Zasmidium cellare]|uniref:2EXR domain-containing protein n=1 Tax=Zasmidium cellare TaxID=395010 RepID=A0ABR0DZT5_ZASCE|nr:hypothetical protein PRZ48_014726 [Zasmidium cellare]
MAADPGSNSEEDTSDTPCLLWTLPQELRDMIYELACDFEVNIVSTTRKATNRKWNPKADVRIRARHTNMGLILACKDLRAEALKIWYTHTIFSCSSPIACATWYKRHVPSKFQGVVKHLRIASPGNGLGHYLKDIMTGQCVILIPDVARVIKIEAEETLLGVHGHLREPLRSTLQPGALQVELFNSEWEPTWTAKPSEIELPEQMWKHPYLQMFNPRTAAITEVATMAPTDPTEKTKPGLLTIPRELRDNIYEYALDGFEVKISGSRKPEKSRAEAVMKVYHDPANNGNTGLMSTCKQLREEAYKLYYQKTAFYVRDWFTGVLWLKRAVSPEMQSTITTLRVACPENFQVIDLVRLRHIPGSGPSECPLYTLSMFKQKAKDEVAMLRKALGKEISSRVAEALQVEIPDDKCQLVWTAKPDTFKLPTVEAIQVFNRLHAL